MKDIITSVVLVIFSFSIILLMTNCGGTDDRVEYRSGPAGKDGKDGVDGKDAPEEVEVAEPISMAGFHSLPNGGYLELIKNEDGRILVYGTQRIYSKNFDQDLALHPAMSAGPHLIKDGILNYEANLNYNSTTNDLEVDGSTSNISGSRKTNVKLQMVDGKLQIKIKTYSSSGLHIDCDRVIVEE